MDCLLWCSYFGRSQAPVPLLVGYFSFGACLVFPCVLRFSIFKCSKVRKLFYSNDQFKAKYRSNLVRIIRSLNGKPKLVVESAF